ncbi:hypothetical protein [Pseudoalteromonas marina]|uniref:hypothetical protein n=1 Tax=Pseudoalteromonas marina TaxID=267375 RepID=UPI003C5199B0
MFSGIWSKIVAFLSAAVAVLLFIVGHRGRKIDELEHDAKINDELKSIREQQDLDEKEILNNEPEQIKKEVKDRSNLSKRDRFNKL